MSLNEELSEALRSPNAQAFLRLIRAGESSQDLKGYFTLVGGEILPSLEQHPGKKVWIESLKLWSSAAGAYQFLTATWGECQKALGLKDFYPSSQDLAAMFLIRRRGALADVLAGRIEVAIKKCAKEWASLPGSPYGQPTRTLKQALATYAEYGGQLSPIQTAQPSQESTPMLPVALLTAFLPSLVAAVPKLAEIFKPESEVAQRNVKAAQVAFDIAKDALQATNEQEVVEKLRSDPTAPAIVQQAIEDRWFELTEAGGGGIEGARKADATIAAAGSMRSSPSFYVALCMLPLVYMIVGAVVGLWGAPFSDDVRAAIANGVVGMIIGGLIGYYYGQTTSRNRSDKS